MVRQSCNHISCPAPLPSLIIERWSAAKRGDSAKPYCAPVSLPTCRHNRYEEKKFRAEKNLAAKQSKKKKETKRRRWTTEKTLKFQAGKSMFFPESKFEFEVWEILKRMGKTYCASSGIRDSVRFGERFWFLHIAECWKRNWKWYCFLLFFDGNVRMEISPYKSPLAGCLFAPWFFFFAMWFFSQLWGYSQCLTWAAAFA